MDERTKGVLQKGAEGIGEFKARLDGWVNTLTGLGTSRDKTTGSTFYAESVLTPEECEQLFAFNDMARTIISAVPEGALREGFSVTHANIDSEKIQLVNDALKALNVREHLLDASLWGRAMGGAKLVLGVEDGADLLAPLRPESVKAVRFLDVLDRTEVFPESYYSDPKDFEKYGHASVYRIQRHNEGGAGSQASVKIHESRMLSFRGARTSRRMRQQNQGWDHSVLQSIMRVLRTTDANWDAVGVLMQDFSQAVYKIAGLIDMITEQDPTAPNGMQKRMALVDTLRSIARAIVLDKEESFEVIDRTLTGVDALLDRTWLRLAAAARMPVTILMGQTPAGLSATGAIDLRWWYDTLSVSRSFEMTPRILAITELVAISLGLDGKGWSVSWPSLWQLSPAEDADLRLKIAQSDQIYQSFGGMLPEEITLSRFAGGVYGTGYSAVDLQAREKIEASTLEGDNALALPEDVKPAETAFNGAQVAALVDIVARVGSGEISRASAVEIVKVAFPVSQAQALALLGPEDFKPTKPEPAQAFGKPAAPAEDEPAEDQPEPEPDAEDDPAS